MQLVPLELGDGRAPSGQPRLAVPHKSNFYPERALQSWQLCRDG